MFFMLCERLLKAFDSVTKGGRYALIACRNVSISGEELSRCFTNHAETSAFYSEKNELRLVMQ